MILNSGRLCLTTVWLGMVGMELARCYKIRELSLLLLQRGIEGSSILVPTLRRLREAIRAIGKRLILMSTHT